MNFVLLPKQNDFELLENLSENKVTFQNQPDNYRNVVIEKPWGHEFAIVTRENASVWYLNMNKDHSTSFHCHPNKKTTLCVVSGSILLKSLNTEHVLNRFDSIEIHESAFHKIYCTEEKTVLLEIESTSDKLDLVRYTDDYNRENMKYEGVEHNKKTEDYSDFFFYTDQDEDHEHHVHDSIIIISQNKGSIEIDSTLFVTIVSENM